MNKHQVAKKYSRAIIGSCELSVVPFVIEEFKAFSRLLESNRKLWMMFAGQIFSDEEKEKAFTAIAPSLGFRSETLKFLKLIVTRGHLTGMREIIAATINIYNEKQKKATALVISPITLGTAFSDRLRKVLKNLTNREIEIENQVDPSLLGGFVVRVGSTIFDSSLKGQLRLLKSELIK